MSGFWGCFSFQRMDGRRRGAFANRKKLVEYYTNLVDIHARIARSTPESLRRGLVSIDDSIEIR